MVQCKINPNARVILKPGELTGSWTQVIWIGVFQYCFFRVAMTVVAVITQYAGRYCEASLSPAFSHIWVRITTQ